jgi:hypothetical protein
LLPLASTPPRGENAIDQTALECPDKVLNCLPVATFQSLIVLSSLPLATSLPSGEKATDQTSRKWLV